MPSFSLNQLFDEVLADRRLLTHPFYVRWENGDLADGELAAYASQYRHFEAELPEFLGVVANNLDGVAQKAVQKNLDDEMTNPRPHVELFDAFVSAVSGSTSMEASFAMRSLVSVYQNIAQRHPKAALAALAAYEVQASDIARSKAEGLRAHYGVDAKGTAFWDVHATMDADHADWTIDTIAGLLEGPADLAAIREAAIEAADAWWAFLDEREALASSFAQAS
jgi:pyrroloquinoline-quinone synthase